MSEREEVLREFTENWDGIEVLSTKRMADEIVRLRSQLAAVEVERNDYRTMYLDLWDASERHASEREALTTRLTTAERERDEARRERDVLRDELAAAQEQRDHWSGAYEGAMQGCEDLAKESLKFKAEADTLRHRAERTERVVEAALTEHRAFEEAERQINRPVLDWDSHKVTAAREAWEIAKHAYRAAVRALDTTEPTP